MPRGRPSNAVIAARKESATRHVKLVGPVPAPQPETKAMEERIHILEQQMLSQRKLHTSRTLDILLKSIKTSLLSTNDSSKIERISRVVEDLVNSSADIL